MRNARTRRLLALPCVAALAAVGGCASDPAVTADPATPTAAVAATPAGAGAPRETAPRPRLTGHVLAEVQPRGTVPFDDLTLPLVSPDGRFIATQAGFPPTWATVLAMDGAEAPVTTRVEIYVLPENAEDPPRRVAAVSEPVVLGRSADARGFLVESPRPNGSRWIGRADWSTGAVTWLVRDNKMVSAFASLGPDGQLAWSARPVDGNGPYDLLVKTAAGTSWRLPGQGSHWLLPTWSGVGDELFVLVLREDRLDAVHLSAASPDDMRQSITRVPLATGGADFETAYQILSASAGVALPREVSTFAFFHPSRQRAALWRPPDAPVLLAEDALASVPDPANEDCVVMTTRRDLVRRTIASDQYRSNLMKGMHLARATGSPEIPWVLFQPRNGAMGVTVMRLIPADGAAFGGNGR